MMGKRRFANHHDDPALHQVCFPCPDYADDPDADSEWDNTVWRLVYGTPTKDDLILARDVMSAYANLLERPLSQARKYVAALRRVVRKRQGGRR